MTAVPFPNTFCQGTLSNRVKCSVVFVSSTAYRTAPARPYRSCMARTRFATDLK